MLSSPYDRDHREGEETKAARVFAQVDAPDQQVVVDHFEDVVEAAPLRIGVYRSRMYLPGSSDPVRLVIVISSSVLLALMRPSESLVTPT